MITVLVFTQNINSQIFTLKGTLTEFDNGTKIIINPYLDNMDIDMDDETVIILEDEKFEFSRQLEKPTKFSLRVQPQNLDRIEEFEHLTFWAENKSMDLAGTKGQVFRSNIRGSVIQDQYFEYIACVANLENMIKQIADSVKTFPNLSETEKSRMRKGTILLSIP